MPLFREVQEDQKTLALIAAGEANELRTAGVKEAEVAPGQSRAGFAEGNKIFIAAIY